MVLLFIVGALTMCENAKDNIVRLSCNDDSKVIHILSAMYGRKETGTCDSCFLGILCNTDCESQDALSRVKNRCEGLSSCHFNADNDFFGDPCPRTIKYARLTYQCVCQLGMYLCMYVMIFNSYIFTFYEITENY